MASCVYGDNGEKFYYDRGFENGWNQGYDLGIQKGIEIAKKVVEKYKDRIRAYEIGKYLIEEKKITYPQIYQIQDPSSGALTIQVTPSHIEQELNIDQIFDIFGTIPTIEQKKDQFLSQSNNSVVLSPRDGNLDSMPRNPSKNSEIIYMNIKKNSQNEKVLRQANLVYEDHKKVYRVMFFNAKEKKDFCSQFKEVCK